MYAIVHIGLEANNTVGRGDRHLSIHAPRAAQGWINGQRLRCCSHDNKLGGKDCIFKLNPKLPYHVEDIFNHDTPSFPQLQVSPQIHTRPRERMPSSNTSSCAPMRAPCESPSPRAERFGQIASISCNKSTHGVRQPNAVAREKSSRRLASLSPR